MFQMISKDSKKISTSGGETLEKALIYFEEEVSNTLSPTLTHPELCANHLITHTNTNNIYNQNDSSVPCGCLQDDMMRVYSNRPNSPNKKYGGYSPTHRHYYSHFTTKRKLLFLVFVASLALLSIVLISEQLIVRHLGRQLNEDNEFYNLGQVEMNPYNHIAMYEEFDILTLEEWAQHETLDFEDNIVLKTEPESETKIDTHPERKSVDRTTTSKPFSKLVEDRIFWSSEIEAAVPPGPTDQRVLIQMQELRDRKIKSLESPNWLHCGREKNRFVHFEDGSNACARYRGPDHAEFIQGELMAFYLARLLGITNTPAVVLSEVRNIYSISHGQFLGKALFRILYIFYRFYRMIHFKIYCNNMTIE